jgi:hypothetical protein
MKLDFETNKPKSFWVAMGLAAFAPILGLLGLAAYELMGRIVCFFQWLWSDFSYG